MLVLRSVQVEVEIMGRRPVRPGDEAKDAEALEQHLLSTAQGNQRLPVDAGAVQIHCLKRRF